MGNPFVHVELRTPDVDRAKEFYSALLDWTLQDVPMGGMTYTTVGVGDGVGGGMLPIDRSDSSQWLAFLEVDSVAGTLDRAVGLGASIVQPESPIPGNGSFAVIADPTGALVGVVQHSG